MLTIAGGIILAFIAIMFLPELLRGIAALVVAGFAALLLLILLMA